MSFAVVYPTEMPPAIILCGGQGTRIRDVTETLPKPMVPVGSQPIIWHIMKSYSAFGVRRFILCLGYRRESIIDYFVNYRARAMDITIHLKRKDDIVFHGSHDEEDWEVTLADTGDNTMTGGRVARVAKYLRPGDEHCFLTYGDGLSNVDIAQLLAFHKEHGKAVTITAVHPASRFGEISLDAGRVTSFYEKSHTDMGIINGGFMVIHRRFIDNYLTTDASVVLEQIPMQRAVADGEARAFVHEDFWQCMDTFREYQLLNQLWDKGNAPWTKHWNQSVHAATDKNSIPVDANANNRSTRVGFAA